MAGYLAMPRPGDLFKAALLPLTFALGAIITGHVDAHMCLRALVLMLALEFLIYPARYQWNDIRGFAADQRHPAAVERGRLPGPVERGPQHIAASGAAAIARLVLAVAVVFVFPGLQLGGLMTIAIAGVFGVAMVYEFLRTRCTGRVDEVPPPLSMPIVLLWITVGAGYVLRGLLGLGLAVGLSGDPALTVAAALTLWAFGIGFVTSRWAIEATAFAHIRDGVVSWQVRAHHAREHLVALVRWLPAPAPAIGSTDQETADAANWTPLRTRTALTSPWNLGYLTAGAAAAVTGELLVSDTPLGLPAIAVGAIAGGLATLVVILCVPVCRAATVLAGAVLIALAYWVGHVSPLAVLPWAVVLLSYCASMRQSLRSIGGWTDRAKKGVLHVAHAMGRLLVGPPVWELLHPSGPAHTTSGS